MCVIVKTFDTHKKCAKIQNCTKVQNCATIQKCATNHRYIIVQKCAIVQTFFSHVVVFVLQSLQRESNGMNMRPALSSTPSLVTLTM